MIACALFVGRRGWCEILASLGPINCSCFLFLPRCSSPYKIKMLKRDLLTSTLQVSGRAGNTWKWFRLNERGVVEGYNNKVQYLPPHDAFSRPRWALLRLSNFMVRILWKYRGHFSWVKIRTCTGTCTSLPVSESKGVITLLEGRGWSCTILHARHSLWPQVICCLSVYFLLFLSFQTHEWSVRNSVFHWSCYLL